MSLTTKIERRKTTPPVLKGSVGSWASAAGVWGNRSSSPPLSPPRRHHHRRHRLLLLCHCSLPKGATLNSLGWIENNVLALQPLMDRDVCRVADRKVSPMDTLRFKKKVTNAIHLSCPSPHDQKTDEYLNLWLAVTWPGHCTWRQPSEIHPLVQPVSAYNNKQQ